MTVTMTVTTTVTTATGRFRFNRPPPPNRSGRPVVCRDVTPEPLVSRRAVLAAGAVGAAAVGLTACSPGAPKGAPSAAAGTTLAALDDIPVGQAVAATLPDGSRVVVARPTAETAACFSARCTHAGCTVKPAGTELDCPCHGSVFDAATGEVRSGPASRALDAVPVTVANGQVVTA